MPFKHVPGSVFTFIPGPGEVDPGYGVGEGRPDQGLPGGGGYPDQGLPGGGRPSHPIVLPPLPGVWPKPGEPSQPIVIPPDVPGYPSQPIIIPIDPSHPIALPPDAVVWPPLPPSTTGKYVILIWVVGVGARWLILEDHVNPTPPKPPTPSPK